MTDNQKSVTVEAMKKPKAIAVDVTGQPGGPSPEEQAMVDAEQLEIIAKIKADRNVLEEEENNRRQKKMDAALLAMQERKAQADTIENLIRRVEALEAKK